MLYVVCFTLLRAFFSFFFPTAVCAWQAELYNHLLLAEMDKVKEQVMMRRAWHETQMQACQTTPKHTAAPISCAQIRAEARVGWILKRLASLCFTLYYIYRTWRVFATPL